MGAKVVSVWHTDTIYALIGYALQAAGEARTCIGAALSGRFVVRQAQKPRPRIGTVEQTLEHSV